MKRPVLYCVSLFLVMLVTGVFWGTWFTLTRSLDSFPPDNFIRIGKTIIKNVGGPMAILMPATLLSLIWISVINRKVRPVFLCFIVSLVFMTLTLLITVGIEVPIDNQIKTWTADSLPGNWSVLRDRWDQYHSIRTLTSILSFLFLSIGVVIDR
ncbi:MAG TPA: DUF1772 domain-containing protein [Flavitalea sp.]|nr:DUF1772 domain-containing protein [Flavitalea sp.]